jgi:hypothetical protein
MPGIDQPLAHSFARQQLVALLVKLARPFGAADRRSGAAPLKIGDAFGIGAAVSLGFLARGDNVRFHDCHCEMSWRLRGKLIDRLPPV